MEEKVTFTMLQFFPLKMLISAGCFLALKCVTGYLANNSRKSVIIRETNGLIHAFIASYLSITAFMSTPPLLDDLIKNSNDTALTCVGISTGYFLADSLVIIFQFCQDYGKDTQSSSLNLNILFHHLAAFGAFYYALCSQLFVGYSTMCLLLEVSSIMLKLRKIWKVNDYPGIGDKRYHLLAAINIILFVIFRMFVIIFAIYWWSKNIHRLPLLYTVLPFSGSIVVGVINIRYFHLLMKSDIMPMMRHVPDKLE